MEQHNNPHEEQFLETPVQSQSPQSPQQHQQNPQQNPYQPQITINTVYDQFVQSALFMATQFKVVLASCIMSVIMVISGLVMIVLGIIWSMDNFTAVGIMFCLIAGILLGTQVGLILQSKKPSKMLNPNMRIVFNFLPDRLHSTMISQGVYSSEQNYSYMFFDFIIETKTHFLLFIQRGLAVVVPKKDITQISAAEFRQFLLTKFPYNFKRPRSD